MSQDASDIHYDIRTFSLDAGESKELGLGLINWFKLISTQQDSLRFEIGNSGRNVLFKRGKLIAPRDEIGQPILFSKVMVINDSASADTIEVEFGVSAVQDHNFILDPNGASVVEISGPAVQGAALSKTALKPAIIGGRYEDSLVENFDNGDAAFGLFDRYGRLRTTGAPRGEKFTGNTGVIAVTNTTGRDIKAAVADHCLFITKIIISQYSTGSGGANDWPGIIKSSVGSSVDLPFIMQAGEVLVLDFGAEPLYVPPLASLKLARQSGTGGAAYASCVGFTAAES